MIISHRRRFIFIKTGKTAGTSLEAALSCFCGKEDILTLIKEEKYRRQISGVRGTSPVINGIKLHPHVDAATVKEALSEDTWNRCFKFCFEREPLDKLISLYYWRNRKIKRYESFPHFINSLYERGIEDRVLGRPLYTIDNEQVVDKVYLYEDMSESLRGIENNLDIEPGSLKLPSLKSGTRPVEDDVVVTDEVLKKVREMFRETYERFYYREKE